MTMHHIKNQRRRPRARRANQVSHAGEVILGLLGTAFFTLLWRRLDRIDARLEKVGDAVMEVKGRMDEISRHV
jgi:hypothetical protein